MQCGKSQRKPCIYGKRVELAMKSNEPKHVLKEDFFEICQHCKSIIGPLNILLLSIAQINKVYVL